jgi:uncharacterized membrane protein
MFVSSSDAAPTPRELRTSRRLLPVDALRGTAMVFVGISHISLFVWSYSNSLSLLLRWVGHFATPNFLLMSGLAAGFQLARSSSAAAVARIVDRGLFVLLMGHVLIAASLVYITAPGTAFEHMVITDTIGFLLCMTPLLRNIEPRTAFVTGGVLYIVSSLLGFALQPHSSSAMFLGELFLDVQNSAGSDAGWAAPTLQYFGIFIVGIGVGKLIYRRRGTGGEAALSWRLLTCGGGAILLAIGMNVVAHVLRHSVLTGVSENSWGSVLSRSLEVAWANPPSLAYALFYGGAGIALVGFLGIAERRAHGRLIKLAQCAAVFGRASFVTYVAQQYLVEFVPMWLGFDTWLTPGFAIVYLLLVVIATFLIADAWDRRNGNRYLTLGLKWIFAPERTPPRRAGAVATRAS